MIVKDYPGDAEWWKQEEVRARIAESTGHDDRGVTVNQRKLLDILEARGEVPRRDVTAMLGLTDSQVRGLADGLSLQLPIYERPGPVFNGQTTVVYGLLKPVSK